MQSTLSILALALAVVAIAVAASTSSPKSAAPARSDGRLKDLEGQVAELSRTVEELTARLPRAREVDPIPMGLDAAIETADAYPGAPSEAPMVAGSPAEARLKAIVDDAVSKKAKEVVNELEIKKNKKPSMEVFATMLELTRDQRYAAEQEVIRGQREAYRILETPTRDGHDLMEELIDLVAKGAVKPGQDHGWGPWVARVTTMKVPGTNETYSAQIESVKASIRTSFKKTFSKEQYAEYQGWQVDPLEIKDIPDSPSKVLEQRVKDRIEQLSQE